MNSRFKQSKLLFWTVEIVLMIIATYFILQMPHIFRPLLTMLSALFMPLLISGFLYYMFNPLVLYLEKKGLPRLVGFSISFIILLGLIVLMILNVIPQLVDQFIALTQSIPTYTEEVNQWLIELGAREEFKNFDLEAQLAEMNLTVSNVLNFALVSLTTSLSKLAGFLMKFFVLLFTVPFILFFMFKDGDKFLDSISHFFPKVVKGELREMTSEIGDTLSAYITSTVLDALLIGVLSFLSFTVLSQPYALLLAVFCGITNIIPYIGPFIGAVPVILVALFVSPWQALYVALAILVIQQLDANLIKPLLMGKSLNIHPLTIILVLIAAGSVGGIVGMIICIPVYAILKVLVLNTRKIYLAIRKSDE